MRKWILCLAAAMVSATLLAPNAWSQAWPTKPIRLIVPYTAGGLSDVFARLIADRLARILGQSVIVDNRPGGNTLIGTQVTAQAAPDGYTLLLTNAALSINQHLVPNLPYDLNKDLAPVIHLGESYGLIFVHPAFPAKTLQEMITVVKAEPGRHGVAVPGLGTNYRIAVEQLKEIAGINVLMIPYKGSSQSITDVLAGQVPIGIDSLVPLAPQVKDGKLRALAVLSPSRAPLLPDVPTTAEAGLPDVVMYAYNALLAPGGTPRPVIDKINSAVNEVLVMPDVVAQAQVLGLLLGGGSPEKLKGVIDKVTGIYGQVVKSANIKPE